MNKLLLAGILGTTSLGLIACGAGGSGSTIGSSRQALEALIPLQGCGEVDDYVRGRMVAAVNKQVDQAIKSINENQYGSCYRGGGGGYTDAGAAMPAPSAGSSPSGSNSGGSSSGGFGASEGDSSSGGKATQTSGTNNQVANVDEADFVKNDGQYLYIVANGALRILRAFPANIAGQVAKIPIEGTPKKLFVEGDRAVVYVSMTPTSPGSSDGSGWSKPYYGSSECTYGYECVPRGDGTSTQILVYDIANRAQPQLLRTIKASGSLLSARRIGNAVHTVLVDQAATLTTLQSYPSDMPSCDDSDSDLEYRAKQITAWEELRTKNLAAIAAAPVQSILPSFTDNDAPAVAECSGYYRPSLEEGRSFTSLLSIDIAGGPSTTATVVSDPGVTYASETGLYLSVPHQQQADAYGGFGGGWYGGMEEEKEASTVHKFRIGATPSLTGYEASGVVKGRVLNQFALDEHEGHLRIATTTGHAPSDGAYSTMSVLQRQDKSLVLTGKVDKIAPSEDIRSVRFDGSRGYIVTFKKTDPLYVFDLGNPSTPAITGELKIPGFSTYMHMMDASHLLTIGYDAADQGSFAFFTGVMLQIFDVSDMKNPTLAHKEVIGTRGSSSEALTNHLAFNYFAPKNLLALPMTICEGGSQNGGFGTDMTFSGLMVYDTTAASGFHLRGKVSHPHTQSGGYDSSACSNWWTQASSEVKRSVIMDDWVYSISEKRVKINALGDLGADIAELSLTD